MADSNQRNDEIDLLELFRLIGRKTGQFFIWIVRSFLLIIAFFVRNALIIGIFIVVGGLIGFVKFKTSKPYYTSEMTLRTNAIKAGDFISYVNRIHSLFQDRNIPQLASILEIEDSTVSQIRDIQAYWIVDVNKDGVGDYTDYKNHFNLKDTTQARLDDRVTVEVSVFQQDAFDKLKSGLHNYMVSSSWVNEINANRIEQLNGLIRQINQQLSKLDSLENFEYFQKDMLPEVKDGQIVFMNEQETKLFHDDIIRLLRLKQNYEKELTVYKDPITVIEDFTPLTRAANPFSKYAMIFVLIFAIAGTLFVFVREQWGNIKKLLEGS